jgi:hypothetical protein
MEMTDNEKEFIECVKQDPERAAQILKQILIWRETSSKTIPAPQQKAV